MFFINKKLFIRRKASLLLLLILCIFGIGFFLRVYNYEKFPRHGATFDEFAWVWLGINLIQKGEPISWSPHPQYKDRKHLVYQGAAFWIVRPYLEHPPLFGLVAGSFAIVSGAKDMYQVKLERIRPLAVLLGMFSIVMIFLLTKELYGINVALLSTVLYATIPTVVIGSRIVQNENFLIPFWLLSLFFIVRYLKTVKARYRNLAAIIAGLLSLAKVPWLVVGLSLVMTLLYKKRWTDAQYVGIVVVLFFSLFIFYGIYFDRDLFFNLWRLQIARYDISFSGVFSLFTDPLLVDRRYIDGWIFFGLFTIVLLSQEFKKHVLVLIPFISYFILYIFAIPNEPAHGWYRFPFYPFLVIAQSYLLHKELSKQSLFSLFFLFFVGLSLLFNTYQEAFGFSYFTYRVFIILAVMSVFFPLWKKQFANFGKVTFLGWILFFIALNMIAVTHYIE